MRSRSPEDGSSSAAQPEDLDGPDATFASPDLTTFCRLDKLGLHVLGPRLEPALALLACWVVELDQWCRRCGCQSSPCDSVTRRLAHESLGWRPTMLEATARRYRCADCGHVWPQDASKAAQPRGETFPSGAALGAGRHRRAAPHLRPRRRRRSGSRGTPPMTRSWLRAGGC